MDVFQTEPIEVEGIQYTGDLKPVKNFLGIKDARYDQVTREMIIGEEGNTKVIHVGDWVTKDTTFGEINILSNGVFSVLFKKKIN